MTLTLVHIVNVREALRHLLEEHRAGRVALTEPELLACAELALAVHARDLVCEFADLSRYGRPALDAATGLC